MMKSHIKAPLKIFTSSILLLVLGIFNLLVLTNNALASSSNYSLNSTFNNSSYSRLAQKNISAKAAAAIARQKFGGKVLNVSTESNGNFIVKLLQDSGRVKIVTISKHGKLRG